MKNTFTYIAFYDLDHTILVDNSATHLVEEARRRGIMSRKQYRHAVYLSIVYKLKIGDPARMINRMLSWLKGLREESIRNLCREVFHHSMIHKIRPEILATLKEHRSRNGAVVLLSSATSPICQPVSEYLRLDDVICTQLEAVNGILTGTTRGKLVYAMEKKHRLHAYCQQHGFNPVDAYYYGDSYTDQHVMESVGNPIAVSPDMRLLKIAMANQWPILVHDR